MIKILFVCLGNICRSPMAEGVFQQLIQEAGLDEQIMVDSAGTGSWHIGEKAHRGTLDVLNRHDIQYNGRARRLTHRDLSDFDYVLAMDASNLRTIQGLLGDDSNTVVRIFLSFAQAAGTVKTEEVPDPYYDGRFDEVYDLVSKGSEALLKHLRQAHDL